MTFLIVGKEINSQITLLDEPQVGTYVVPGDVIRHVGRGDCVDYARIYSSGRGGMRMWYITEQVEEEYRKVVPNFDELEQELFLAGTL